MEKLAELAGLKNASTARVTWNTLKRKLLSGDFVSPLPSATPNKGKKRTATKAVNRDDNDDDDEEVDPTPVKKQKPRGRPLKVPEAGVKKEEDDQKVKQEEEQVDAENSNYSIPKSNFPGV